MKKLILYTLTIVAIGTGGFAQVAINASGSSPDPSAGLDVDFNDKGFLPPRLTTTERDNISTPTEGLQIFNTTTKCLEFYVNSGWQAISCGCTSAPTTPGPISGNTDQTPGATGQIYSINAVSGATGYTWTVPSGWTITSGTGSASIEVTTGSAGDDGDITVTADNNCGSSSSQTLAVTVSVPCVIGNTGPGGGIIFYCGSAYSGKSGLESMITDQSVGTWGCSGTNISTLTNIGAGQTNTANIVAGCGTAGIAAKICDDLSSGGQTDWFLPSQAELNEMYNEKTTIGNFGSYYWSSSQSNSSNAWRQYFVTGTQENEGKHNVNSVRCIRAF